MSIDNILIEPTDRMPYTEKRKQEIMVSRALHKTNYNDYQRKYMRTMRANSWEYISKVFFKILRDELPKKKYPHKIKPLIL